MFQSIRNQKRWLMLIAMIMIIPAFVFIGINGYSRLNPDANAIAKVDGKGIQPEEFDRSKREFIEARRQEQEGNFDPTAYENRETNAQILRTLAMDRAIDAQVAKKYVAFSEADAVNVIKNADAFKKDGRFNPELYENFLAARGKSDAQFVAEMRKELATAVILNAINQTALLPKKTLSMLNDILREERVVRTLTFKASSYKDDVKVTPEEIDAYYKAHQDEFRVPERLDVQYVVMSADTLKPAAQPSDEVLKQFFDQNKTKYMVDETRRASHILIEPNAAEKDAAKADAAAKAKAENLLRQVQKNPSKFAELAKANSADTGSAQGGGDLDYFSKGQMVPEFDQAVFSAKKGDIVGPVKTEFGYHVIRVTDVVPAHGKTFEEVKDEITKLWEGQQRSKEFAENADAFTNMVYEQSDSLEPAAEKFGLKIQTLNGLTEKGFRAPNPEAAKLFTNRVVRELFSSEAVQEKRNIQAVEVAPNTLLSARVVKVNPAHTQTLDEAKEAIRNKLVSQAAAKLAQEAGEAKLSELKKTKNLDGFSAAETVSRIMPQDQSVAVIAAEMAPPAKELPAFTGAKAPNGSYVVSYVESSTMPKSGDADMNQIRISAMRAQSTAEDIAYYEALLKLYNYEILKKEYEYKPEPVLK